MRYEIQTVMLSKNNPSMDEPENWDEVLLACSLDCLTEHTGQNFGQWDHDGTGKAEEDSTDGYWFGWFWFPTEESTCPYTKHCPTCGVLTQLDGWEEVDDED